ncbi:MAG: leucine-rich repeat domain-containing protein, partial [Lachnospiraceae bacterium]|nr:leucine-rich repeat domain-containing protein [Lachnospiraceae bacterium]
KLGDVNSDGLIDAVDASMVLSEYAKVSSNINGSFSDNQKKAADVDANSFIDAVDASKILSYYAYVSSGSGQKVSLSEFIKK